MKILISGASAPFAFAIADALRKKHELRLTDSIPVETDDEFIVSELYHDEATDQLLIDMDALICLPYSQCVEGSETDWVDISTRRQYNLLSAAVNTDVRQVIILSTLDLMTPYDPDMTVTEDWKPLPGVDPETLGAHLTEFVSKEFAHSNVLNVSILRLGHLIKEQDIGDKDYDPMWLAESDAAQAISLLIDQGFSTTPPEVPYRILHLQSISKLSRFSCQRICDLLTFVPTETFEKYQ